MTKIHDFKNGDRVTMLENFSSIHPEFDESRFAKGDTGVITECFPTCWEIQVKIDKNNKEYGCTEKCMVLLEETPIHIKYHIELGNLQVILNESEMYELYCKLKKVKRQFTFKNRKIKLNKKQFEIALSIVKKIVVGHLSFYE